MNEKEEIISGFYAPIYSPKITKNSYMCDWLRCRNEVKKGEMGYFPHNAREKGICPYHANFIKEKYSYSIFVRE